MGSGASRPDAARRRRQRSPHPRAHARTAELVRLPAPQASLVVSTRRASCAPSAGSSAGPSADSGSEAAPAGFYVTLVVGAVVLCAILCCLRRLLRRADHLHRQQAARHSPNTEEPRGGGSKAALQDKVDRLEEGQVEQVHALIP